MTSKAIGKVKGLLRISAENENKVLEVVTDSTTQYFGVTYSYRFKNWLANQSEITEEDMINKSFKYIVLPRTYAEEPNITFTILGLENSDTEEGINKFNVRGVVRYQNRQYNYNLIKIRTPSNRPKIIKVIGSLEGEAVGKKVDVSTILDGRYLYIDKYQYLED